MNKKIIFLLSVPILGFMLFLVIHFSFLDTLHKLNQKAQNLRVKQIISSDIKYEIVNIKSMFYQIPLISTNQKSLSFNINELKQEIKKTENLLNILKKGGEYHKKIALNILNKDYFEKVYYFKQTSLPIEVIDLFPKLRILDNKLNVLDKDIKLFFKAIKENDIKQIKKQRKKIIKFSRSLDSIFRRMIENSNRLFYESQIELLDLENKIKQKSTYYQNIEFSLILFLIFMFILVGYVIIDELTLLNKTLKNKLYKDELTNTFSRTKLEEKKFNKNSIVILVDIDDFSGINELYGMEIGNKILKIVSNKLKNYNSNWEIYRVSADVFGLYLDDKNKMLVDIEEKIFNIREHLIFESIKIDDYTIDLNVTIGVAIGENALSNALIALSISKSENLPYKIYTHNEIRQDIEFTQIWQKEIKYALLEDRIEPFFQPIVDKEKNIIKYECLMRLRKDDKEVKYIPPFFLDVAIKTKQYLALSRALMEKIFITFKDGGEFSINLTYMDMKSDITKNLLEDLIIKYNAQNRVTFEILESEGIKDYQLIEDFIKYFRQYGVEIAIDDFGSGYSNFKRILALNPDFIKFDGSLIKNIDTDTKSYIIVKNMVNYAKELNIKTIAEYIHNKDVFDTCVYLGIDYFQGFYISRPKKEIECKN